MEAGNDMAGRIRSIKPELREWFAFASLSDGAARLFLMLYTIVDDEGRAPAQPAYLAGQIFFAKVRPPGQIAKMLGEIASAGLVEVYAAGGGVFLQIVGWDPDPSQSDIDQLPPTRQRIEKRQPSRYPGPRSIQSTTLSPTTSPPVSVTDLRSPISEDDHREINASQGSLVLASRASEIGQGGGPKKRSAKSPPSPAERAIAMRVLAALTRRNGTEYRGSDAHVKLIAHHIREGVTEGELRAVVAFCADERPRGLGWQSEPSMAMYLRPETLFGPKTLSKYLDTARTRYAAQIAIVEADPTGEQRKPARRVDDGPNLEGCDPPIPLRVVKGGDE